MSRVDAEEDLEALFERLAAEREAAPAEPQPAAPAAPAPAEPGRCDVFERIGALTRQLHDALRELGYDKLVHDAVESLPDARQRLSYIATLTGQAAERVLGAVEKAKGVQDAVHAEARGLDARWRALYAGELGVEGFKALAGETREFLAALPGRAENVNALLHDVMMAQDFHDLTGQVIQRLAGTAQTLEEQLVKLLLETTPPGRRSDLSHAWLRGPSIDKSGAQVAADQREVDTLLESLGF
jgi:chemotaxis protein CheZ